MLYLLFQLRGSAYFKEARHGLIYSGLNLFQYITFRAAFAAITAFLIGVFLGPFIIRRLNKMGVIERSRTQGLEAPAEAAAKKIPTMGGVFIVLSIVIATALWAKPTEFTFLAVLAVAWLGMVGLIDDYTKLRGAKRGISTLEKLILQTLLAVSLAFMLYYFMKDMKWGMSLNIPFFSNGRLGAPSVVLPMLVFIALAVVVIVGSSNAVNLTDGMDGLAIGCTIMASIAFTVISYLAGHAAFASYLKIPYIPGAGELAVFCSAVTGAGLAFLWYNCAPAEVYMGDTGSLALGGALGYVAVVTRNELGLLLVGGIFVVEALSVMIQVFWYKRTRRRVFLRSPIHHHFQLKGIPDTKVVVRFIIVAAILTAFAIATLKIR